ncbi:MAG: chain length determinant protein tyrosine kinase EpsG [Methylotenera sp.]|jgi:chain length determinant protein tyrosine kinase EpsG|uniref:chain length determinant protein tyrosine kinase EpsG n=1 Tax=Methylotenera sp. TaxID=2051956 RepID=UPI0027168302|nr:chain length determinant protein tyrosine kinase EpsG [Methylotenera sp.]MDO9149914.1 chain length determinant protein tyrosine kinase EpsG [Methylotenera sp.]
MLNDTQVQSDTTVIMNPARESSIGKLLLHLGKITPTDAENILLAQQKQGLRFGDAAIKLGLITEADIRQVLALQFDYPYLQAGHGNYSNKLVAAYQPFTQQVETLRALRSQLMMRWFSEGYKSIAIVSASAEEGSSYLAANLAIVFSQLGEKTLLVDANLRSPSQHTIFKLKENRGLSDILAGRASLDIATKVDAFVDLSVLGAGTLPPNPQELLSRATFTSFMNQAIAQYDVVLVDSTPAANTADAQATVARCGGALLVLKLNHTRITDLSAMRDQLSLTGAQVVGAVINDF